MLPVKLPAKYLIINIVSLLPLIFKNLLEYKELVLT